MSAISGRKTIRFQVFVDPINKWWANDISEALEIYKEKGGTIYEVTLGSPVKKRKVLTND